MTVDPAHLALLHELSTDDRPHSGRTLFDHLVGTHDLLDAWGHDAEIRAAGLFHSIYGTTYYRVQSATLDRRPQVAAVIGDEAERLAFLFCVTDRPQFFVEAASAMPVLEDRVSGTTLPVTPATIDALIEIEVANVVEQVDPATTRPTTVALLQDMLDRGHDHMTPGAHGALTRLAERCVKGSA